MQNKLKALREALKLYKYFAIYGGSPKIFRYGNGNKWVDSLVARLYTPKDNLMRRKACVLSMGLHRSLLFLPLCLLGFPYIWMAIASLLAGVPYYIFSKLSKKYIHGRWYMPIRLPELINTIVLVSIYYGG